MAANLRQTYFATAAAPVFAGGNVMTDLGADFRVTPVVEDGDILLVHFSAGGTRAANPSSAMYFQIYVDAVMHAVGRTASNAFGDGQYRGGVQTVVRVAGLAAGAHVVKVQAASTGVDPTYGWSNSIALGQHLALLVERVRV